MNIAASNTPYRLVTLVILPVVIQTNPRFSTYPAEAAQRIKPLLAPQRGLHIKPPKAAALSRYRPTSPLYDPISRPRLFTTLKN